MISEKIKKNGPLLMAFASFIFSLMGAIIKHVGEGLPCMEIVFFRSIFSLIILTVLIIIFNTRIINNQSGLLILRGILGFLAFTIFYYAITKMHLTKISVILQTRPFLVLILAYLFLKEQLSGKEFLILIVSSAGVLFMLISKQSESGIDFLSLICLLGVFFAASSAVIVKYVTATIPTICILFYFMFVSSACSFPLIINNFVLPTQTQLFLLILIGVLSTLAQLLLTQGIKLSKATISAMVGYLGVVFSTFWEFLFWNNFPDLLTIFGGIIIGISVMVLATQKAKNQSV